MPPDPYQLSGPGKTTNKEGDSWHFREGKETIMEQNLQATWTLGAGNIS